MRKRPEIPKHLQKKVARQLLERQKRAGVYEKGLKDVGKGFLAGSAYPVDIAEMVAKPGLTQSASVKAASMRPRGGGIPETVAPVQDPKLKGTYPYVARKMGLDPDSAEGIAGSFFSLDPMAKAHAVAMGTKMVAGKLAGLGLGASVFGGLKKVGKAEDAAKPIFTSPGAKATADISKETIPANKVKSQLEGRGVGKDEMEWTGFNEWIKTKKGEVSKAEIEEFFQQNQIQVQEVIKGGKGNNVAEMEEIARERTADELYALMSNDEILYKNRNTIEPLIQSYKEDADEGAKLALDEWFGGYGYDDQNYIDSYYQYEFGKLESTYTGSGDTKWQEWQLPGGENYRELLLIVPPKKVPWTKENVVPISQEEYAKEIGISADSLGSNTQWFFRTPDGVERISKKQNKATDYLIDVSEELPPKVDITQEQALEQVLTQQPEPKPRYTGGHFQEDDVVAHIRFNERVDPDGNKVLFIEEIQSDWAHKGEQVGFKTDEVKEILKKKELAEARMKEVFQERRDLPWFEDMSDEGKKLYNENTKNLNEWSDRQGGMGDARQDVGLTKADKELGEKLLKEQEEIRIKYDPYYDKREVLNKEYEALEKERAALGAEYVSKGKGGSAPTAEPGPFVTDIHQWTNLALKRMIRWGSDNGFDSIAWVTGKQSADRYKVSKTVDSIYWNPDSTRLVAIQKGSNDRVINELVPEDKLADYIGKEPANRLLESQKGAGDKRFQQLYDDGLIANFEKEYMTNSHSLEGADLDIGGEYHKLIYDQVLTAQAKKIGKKHGAKVEEKAALEPDYDSLVKEWNELSARRNESLRRGEEGVVDFEFTPEDDRRLEVVSRQLGSGPGEGEEIGKVWSMRLTDKLKQASREGLPYYVALPPLVMGATAQRSDAQKQQSKSDAQAILAN